MMVLFAPPSSSVLFILCLHIVSFFVVDALILKSCDSPQCFNGDYEINNESSSCQCHPGWHGGSCQYCGGKMRYSI